MKFNYFLSVAALCAITFFSACKNDSDAVREAAVQSAGGAAPAEGTVSAAPATPAATTPPAAEPPQNAAGVWHYTCPKGCAGGAGAAAPCPKCGTTLAHNTAYHPNTNSTTATPSSPVISPVTAPVTTPITPPATAEPAQNKAGVWHYTCSAGCAGGAGTAAACAKCGKTLAHNAAYHQ